MMIYYTCGTWDLFYIALWLQSIIIDLYICVWPNLGKWIQIKDPDSVVFHIFKYISIMRTYTLQAFLDHFSNSNELYVLARKY